ncbi:hypothetical protein [Halorubrum sp. SD683]|uniref:hypothetical protein n=1 Tax=Halorubrum sp. SD683 TaxID=1855873 RepID=UPI00117ADADD|nr:hypothetical protein [Halorubrum sp. SD683]
MTIEQRRNVYPTMVEAAKAAIDDFSIDIRMKSDDRDAPMPGSARKSETLIRLPEDSARIRISGTVKEGMPGE